MVFSVEFSEEVDKQFKKLSRRDKKQLKAIHKKVRQVAENPYQFKPLKKPMQNKRRVHVGSFVLVCSIEEKSKKVKFLIYAHHDEAYK